MQIIGNCNYVEYDCNECPLSFTAIGNIKRGFSDSCDINCPKCNKHLGTMRCDSGAPKITEIRTYDKSIEKVDNKLLNIVKELYEIDEQNLDNLMNSTNSRNIFHLGEKLLKRKKIQWNNQYEKNIIKTLKQYDIKETPNLSLDEKHKIELKYIQKYNESINQNL